jgi:Fe2+ transport system protein FeoA
MVARHNRLTFGFEPGNRVELHQNAGAADHGQLGTIVKVGNQRLWIRMDRSAQKIKIHPSRIFRVLARDTDR